MNHGIKRDGLRLMNLGEEMKPPAAESADPRDMPVKVVESSGSGIPGKVVAVQSFPEGRREIMMSPAEERFMAVEGGKLRGISNPLKNKMVQARSTAPRPNADSSPRAAAPILFSGNASGFGVIGYGDYCYLPKSHTVIPWPCS